MRAGIALGSNLGDRLAHLCAARDEIIDLPGVEEPFLFSAIYETEPVGCERGAGSFLNAVMEIGYDKNAENLMHELASIESSLGRERSGERNLSRTIDLDLLYLGNVKMQTPEIELPHPRATVRRFVLEPLAEIRPDLKLPGQKKNVKALLAKLPGAEQVVRVADEW
ncbi:MAG: 2-amino-4-hydroxy-6-hydroxymethyldihydropteridine diphosphokinase [Verrucomicrobiota bacterium]